MCLSNPLTRVNPLSCPQPCVREFNHSSTVFLPWWSTLDIRFTDVRRDKCSPWLLLQLSSYASGSIKLTELRVLL